MRLLFIINTPGQAHTWKYIITELQNKGNQLKLIARDYGLTPTILRNCGFQFDTFKTVGSRHSRLLGAPEHFRKCYQLSRSFSPDMVIGFGIDAAVTAARLRKPAIVFIDDDHTPLQNRLTALLGSMIVTPECFKGKLGRRHIRVKGYKELAYLHPNYFTPDVTVFDEMNLARGEKYILLRFNSWDAVHDIGNRGFLYSDKFRLVNVLGEYAHVFISPEAQLPKELEKYRLLTPYTRFHHVVYYAQMFVGDTGTTAAEAAILGTPSILCNQDGLNMGNFNDLNKYGLLYCYPDSESAIRKAIELFRQPDLKAEWVGKRRVMLAEKTDVSRFMVDFIENYGICASIYNPQTTPKRKIKNEITFNN